MLCCCSVTEQQQSSGQQNFCIQEHPKTELSALDHLSQQNGFQLDFTEPVRVPRFANKDWGKPGTTKEHKKINLAWCVGSALFASP